MDKLNLFIEEVYMPSIHGRVGFRVIYATFQHWLTEKYGSIPPLKAHQIYKSLDKHPLYKNKRYREGKCLIGIERKPDVERPKIKLCIVPSPTSSPITSPTISPSPSPISSPSTSPLSSPVSSPPPTYTPISRPRTFSPPKLDSGPILHIAGQNPIPDLDIFIRPYLYRNRTPETSVI